MKYRKKPVLVEAVQWFPGAHIEGVTEVAEMGAGAPESHGEIETLEGKMIVSCGDWVITGVMGEKYPCKPDIFAKTYELAECKEKEINSIHDIDLNLPEGKLSLSLVTMCNNTERFQGKTDREIIAHAKRVQEPLTAEDMLKIICGI